MRRLRHCCYVLLFSAVIGASVAGQPSLDDVIVRAYYPDLPALNALVAEEAPWEVDRTNGFVRLNLTSEAIEALRAVGWRVVEEQTVLDYREANASPELAGLAGIDGFPCYRTVEETYQSASTLAADHPDIASWTDIGDSWEKTQDSAAGYDIQVLRITNFDSPHDRAPVLFTFGTHAREYTPVELGTRFGELLVAGYNNGDADVTWLLDHTDIHLVLIKNPDGRKKAEQGLLWRKNTKQNCLVTNQRGVDLNRNYPSGWGQHGGSSGNSCSSVYRGESAASEPETQALIDYASSVFEDQRGPNPDDAAPINTKGIYLDVHSYGQLVLWPWGYDEPSPNDADYVSLGRKVAWYSGGRPQQAADLYVTDGTTDDYYYDEFGVASLAFEIGTAFFESCSLFENSLLDTYTQTLLYLLKAARAPYHLGAGPEVTGMPTLDPVVAGTPVVLEVTASDNTFSRANGNEPVQDIAGISYSIDTLPAAFDGDTGAPLEAADGSFDSDTETATVTIETSGLAPGSHLVFAHAVDASGRWGVVTARTLEILPGVSTDVRVALQGSDIPMRTDLVDAGLFPDSQPFAEAPYSYPGLESVTPADNMVDWVLVSLREDPAGPDIAKRAAILLDDGSVVNHFDGGRVLFNAPSGSYHVIVKHRNHLAVVSNAKIQVR